MSEKAWPNVKRIATGWLVDSGRVLAVRTRKRVATKAGGLVSDFSRQSVQSITQPDVERWLTKGGEAKEVGP